MNWKDRFSDLILERGQRYYEIGRVKNVANNRGHHIANVRGSKKYSVSVFVDETTQQIRMMNCNCPYAFEGHNCKHIAAVLFSIEDEYNGGDFALENQIGSKEKSIFGKPTVKEPEEIEYLEKIEDIDDDGFLDKEEKYSYLEEDRLLDKLMITPRVMEKALGLIKNKRVLLKGIDVNYQNNYDGAMLDVKGILVDPSGVREQIELKINQKNIISTSCFVNRCDYHGNYFRHYTSQPSCEHIAALFILTIKYVRDNHIGDNTDYDALILINNFAKKRKNLIEKSLTDTKSLIKIVPRLEKEGNVLSVSFRTGDEKLYIIKSLSTFVEQVVRGEIGQYGKSARFPHDIDSFDAKAKPYVDFIKKYVVEEEHVRSQGRYASNDKDCRVGTFLKLHGSRLDEFFQLIKDEVIEYSDREGVISKRQLSCREANPKLEMRIMKKLKNEKSVFDGVRVSFDLPDFLIGNSGTYFIEDGVLNKIDDDFAEELKVWMDARYNYRRSIAFNVGRNYLANFYHSVLPELTDIFQVIEEDSEEIDKYISPEVKYAFYLDAENDNVTCKGLAIYGEEEFPLLDVDKTLHPEKMFLAPLRETDRETETLGLLKTIVPYVDGNKYLLHCNADEECIYRLLEDGLDKLLEMGEVNSTNSFKNLRVRNKTKVAVGVSLSNGLLDISISSEDISSDELLEVLDSYKRKKKFHRLRNGDFLNTDDESLEMLNAMINDIGISPKKLAEGSLKIPAYRAMYIDKMLEENEGIYAERDSHFRSMIKDFKTISESDFEEPDSLKKILRNYQIKGYKWLRTVETYGFGGILADDMGLGKTLQMISVLLTYKESNPESDTPSLIVCPASLVFNWQEEFSQFANTIKVGLVVGSQSERQEIIKKYLDFDVLVTSYDLLKRDIAAYKDIQFNYQVIDEAQYIKNHSTAAAKAVKLVNSRVKFALTGTPIENRLSELWSIFDFLMPGFLFGYDVFKRTFEKPIVKDQDKEATARLQKMVSPFILRRMKKDVLKELPDKIEKVRFDRFEEKQQLLYDGQVTRMKQKIASQEEKDFQKNKMLILAELTKIRQICCDPSLCFEDYDGQSAKREGCMELVQSAIEGEHKILLFSQFTSMLELIRQDFEREGISYFVITGATPKEKRLQLVNSFNKDDTQVFLISLKAGGTGLNLTGADVVIHYDPWWNLAVQNQATDRAHRIGQTKVVTEYKLIAKNTIEEKIQELQEKKKDLADQIINGEGGQLGSMSKEDLMELLDV
ncbi:MAG: SNF2 helicase associated domain-containing protein [Anaerovoracaceae bacterium]